MESKGEIEIRYKIWYMNPAQLENSLENTLNQFFVTPLILTPSIKAVDKNHENIIPFNPFFSQRGSPSPK